MQTWNEKDHPRDTCKGRESETFDARRVVRLFEVEYSAGKRRDRRKQLKAKPRKIVSQNENE